MGVLYDYFRASDRATAATVADRPGGPLATDGSGAAAFDGVAARGIDPVVTLGQLVAFVRGVSWTPELVGAAEISRSSASEAWVERLGEPVRDWLAGVADDALPEIVVKWSQIEEFVPADEPDDAELFALVTDLVALARRARAAGDQLYCWCCF
jgi:hypothetical protein